MMGVAASGGYYVACGCDFIMAHPTTVTGSIGVIAILPNFTKMLDKVGIKANIIKSGKMKDAGSPLKELTQDEREYFQDMLDTFYKNFLQVVGSLAHGGNHDDQWNAGILLYDLCHVSNGCSIADRGASKLEYFHN